MFGGFRNQLARALWKWSAWKLWITIVEQYLIVNLDRKGRVEDPCYSTKNGTDQMDVNVYRIMSYRMKTPLESEKDAGTRVVHYKSPAGLDYTRDVVPLGSSSNCLTLL